MKYTPRFFNSSPSVGTGPLLDRQRAEFKIIRQINKGETEEFRYFVATYKNQIFSMVLRMISDHGIAEDLTQEIFVRAFKNLSAFRFESSFKTWLTRIALNHTHSYFQSGYYQNKKQFDSFVPESHDVSSENADLEPTNDWLEAFRAALSELPRSFREVVVLCALEGKSYEEAAAILSVPLGTVRSRLNRGRLQLRTLMCRRGGKDE